MEQIRQRIESWTGCKGKGTTGEYTGSRAARSQEVLDFSEKVVSDVSSTIVDGGNSEGKPAKSILRTPKYTKQPMNSVSGTEKDQVKEEATLKLEVQEDATVRSESAFVCKNVVVERDPTKPMRKRKVKPRPPDASSHSMVEGYVPSIAGSFASSDASEIGAPGAQFSNSPTTTHPAVGTSSERMAGVHFDIEPNDDTPTKDDEENPIILNSLEDLFQAAGDLPAILPHDRNKVTADTNVLEADIAFSVMTQEQYDDRLTELREQNEEERQAQLRVFMGTEQIFDGSESDERSEASDEEDEDLMEILMGGNEMSEEDFYQDYGIEEDDDVRQPRVFRLLWDTLAEWFTPEGAQYLSHLVVTTSESDSAGTPWKPPAIERSDIEASRCAGLMAMVKLYLPNSLEELGFPQELRRTADIRLGELLRSFSYVLEAPKLPAKLWKAMTCILLEIVLVENQKVEILTLPRSVAAVGMTMDEYRYLSRTAVKNFGVEGP